MYKLTYFNKSIYINLLGGVYQQNDHIVCMQYYIRLKKTFMMKLYTVHDVVWMCMHACTQKTQQSCVRHNLYHVRTKYFPPKCSNYF